MSQESIDFSSLEQGVAAGNRWQRATEVVRPPEVVRQEQYDRDYDAWLVERREQEVAAQATGAERRAALREVERARERQLRAVRQTIVEEVREATLDALVNERPELSEVLELLPVNWHGRAIQLLRLRNVPDLAIAVWASSEDSYTRGLIQLDIPDPRLPDGRTVSRRWCVPDMRYGLHMEGLVSPYGLTHTPRSRLTFDEWRERNQAWYRDEEGDRRAYNRYVQQADAAHAEQQQVERDAWERSGQRQRHEDWMARQEAAFAAALEQACRNNRVRYLAVRSSDDRRCPELNGVRVVEVLHRSDMQETMEVLRVLNEVDDQQNVLRILDRNDDRYPWRL